MFLSLAPLASLAPSAASAQGVPSELRSGLEDQQSVTVTIYNDNLALVKDQRRVSLPKGGSQLALRDVSARIRPETALLRSTNAPGSLQVWEQNFDFDLLSPQKLLEKSVGKTVTVIRNPVQGGPEVQEPATVLATQQGVVLRMGTRIETGVPGRLVFSELPPELRDRPTLVMSVQNQSAAAQDLELSYLTTGLAWKADYVLELNDAEDALDLSGWVTLTNTSGTAYRNARLQLVAGQVNQVPEDAPMEMRARGGAVMAMAAKMADGVEEEALFEYHLYTLPRTTTLADNQTKQVALMQAAGVPARKTLELRGADYYYQSSVGDLGQKLKVGAYLEFENVASAQLGLPLPKGTVRVYKRDAQGRAQFVGEDRMDHTPKGEKVRLKLGESFDVTASKRQTDYKRLPGNAKFGTQMESAYEIVLKNGKSEPMTVTVLEPIPGEWQVMSANHPVTKGAANTAVWTLKVPAQGQTTLNYRVQTRW